MHETESIKRLYNKSNSHKSIEELRKIYPPKFEIGDIVELAGIYREGKIKAKKTFRGIVLSRVEDANELKIGASFNHYEVEGVGHYGEAALKKCK